MTLTQFKQRATKSKFKTNDAWGWQWRLGAILLQEGRQMMPVGTERYTKYVVGINRYDTAKEFVGALLDIKNVA